MNITELKKLLSGPIMKALDMARGDAANSGSAKAEDYLDAITKLRLALDDPEWVPGTNTVGELVNNLCTLDQNLMIYGAQRVTIDGEKRTRTVKLMFSHERIQDGRWIGGGHGAPNAVVMWTGGAAKHEHDEEEEIKEAAQTIVEIEDAKWLAEAQRVADLNAPIFWIAQTPMTAGWGMRQCFRWTLHPTEEQARTAAYTTGLIQPVHKTEPGNPLHEYVQELIEVSKLELPRSPAAHPRQRLQKAIVQYQKAVAALNPVPVRKRKGRR